MPTQEVIYTNEMIMKGAAQYLTGWKHNNITTSFFKVTTNTYQIISKMQRQCVKDSYVGDTVHEAKNQKPTNDKPNINVMDLQVILKNFIKQIKERLQFMKTIEGTYLNIQD